MHKLPGRISSVVAATILLIVVMAAFVIVWMTRALDRQALEQSKVQVEIVRENMLATVDLITIDYSKWGWAYAAVQDQDLEWLFGNIGSAALIGEAVQLAVIWGGPFEADLGWNDDGTVEPRPGLVPAETLEAAESLLADTVPGKFEAVEFFQWQGEDLFVMGASHFEPTGDPTRVPEVGRQTGLLLMGTRIDGEAIAAVARSLSLSGTAVTHDLPADQPSIALPGKDGEPVAYFVWDQPRPGTAMLRQMAPFLLLLTIGAVVLSAANIRFAQRGARTLVLSEQRASRSARTDGLTELPNRAAFNEAIAEAARADERAILFLDINDFSRINDTIGHAVGDQVIVAVARQLSLLVKPNHLLARIGGDEFVFLVTGPDAAAEVRDLAVKARGVFARPLIASKHQLQLRCAIGYAVQTSDDLEGEDLVKQADLAMYEAKRQKSSEPVAFSSVLDNASRNAAIIEQGLRQALLQPDQISVVYQPIVDSNGHLVRAEALARWTSPTLGSMPPDLFIKVAERAGLIIDLGRLLIGKVCSDLAAHPELKIALNISPIQLMAPEFISILERELQTRGIEVCRVEIELTESVVVDDTILAAERLLELSAAGFTTALDDFGTGYSSMGYLARLPFQTVKIDRSFVSKLDASERNAAVVDGMIRIAHGLGLDVVCEGVETAEEWYRLRAIGCDLGQGYYFDAPLPIAALAARWMNSPSLSPVPDPPQDAVAPFRGPCAQIA